MRRSIHLLLMLSVLAVLSCAGDGGFTNGVYEGTGEGYYGEVVVEVRVANGRLSEITITESGETAAMADAVTEALIPRIIEAQGTEGVDTVTGASGTSRAVIQAVNGVLQEARAES